MKEKFPVPDSIMIPVCEQVSKECGHCADSFRTFERRRIKELIGPAYAHVDEDSLGNRAVRLRKGNKLKRMLRGHGPSQTPKLSKELKDHYKSLDYRKISDAAILEAGGHCRICFAVATECHHRKYDTLGTSEEIHDLIAVCRKCHNLCDKRRRRESGG